MKINPKEKRMFSNIYIAIIMVFVFPFLIVDSIKKSFKHAQEHMGWRK